MRLTFLHFLFSYNIAFSIFAFAEYIVAVANMAYYWTIVQDLPTEQVVVMRPGTLTQPQSMPKTTDAAAKTYANGIGTEDGE